MLSYELITRSRFDFDYFDLIPCERHDIIRRVGSELQLARREVRVMYDPGSETATLVSAQGLPAAR